jgi:hypothetical protein
LHFPAFSRSNQSLLELCQTVKLDQFALLLLFPALLHNINFLLNQAVKNWPESFIAHSICSSVDCATCFYSFMERRMHQNSQLSPIRRTIIVTTTNVVRRQFTACSISLSVCFFASIATAVIPATGHVVSSDHAMPSLTISLSFLVCLGNLLHQRLGRHDCVPPGGVLLNAESGRPKLFRDACPSRCQ